MSWQKISLAIILFILVVLVTMGLTKDYRVYLENRQKMENLKAQVLDINANNDIIKEDVDFYSDPDNLTKELKARFNYKKPGEKLLIVVPNESEN